MAARGGSHRWRWGISIAAVIALVFGAVGIARLLVATRPAETIQLAAPGSTSAPAPTPSAHEATTMLLLGSDRRDASDSLLGDLGSRADTIIVAHIPADGRTVQLMSIMRDSWVDIPGHGVGKVNAALSLGGVPLMIATVESLIQQPIDHVAVVDFAGLTALTDALGGVTIDNPTAFTGRGTTFAAGEIELRGDDVLDFVRERYAFSDGDYHRVQNQQAFLSGILHATREQLRADPLSAVPLAEAMMPYVATSDHLTTAAIVELAIETRGADVRAFTLPTAGTGMEGDQSVVYIDPAGLDAVRAALAAESMTDFTPPPVR